MAQREHHLRGGNKMTARPRFRVFLGALAGGLLIAGFGPTSAIAAPTPMVDLDQASTYAVLSGASVANTVSAPGAPHTILRGDLGVKANAQPLGFPPGVVTGTTNVGNVAADQAHADVVAAYTEIAARTGGAPLALALAGETLTPGLYTIPGAASNTTTLTLDGEGDPNAVFVFQINGALAFAAGSKVVLKDGAQASHVFWQVNGAGAVGANAEFAGTLIAMDAVGVGNGTLVNGRAFARNGALTLDNNQFYSSPPAVTIAGGDSAHTTDSSPTISGTTDVESPGTVTVTVAGQTLTATPTDGAWSVTSALLANGTYTVVASTTDGAGNLGSATQELTVDTVPPVVTLDGGASATTEDPTPTISGTSDVAVDTVIRVSVDSQTLHALVNSGGTWNVAPAALADGTYTVTASVRDPAGNEGTDSQSLTIDTAAPPEPVLELADSPNQFEFAGVKPNKRKGIAKLKVKVPGSGDLRLAKNKKVKPARKEAEGAGVVKLKVRPRGPAKRKLNQAGDAKPVVKVRVKAKVTYAPDGGAPRTKTKRLKLVKRA